MPETSFSLAGKCVVLGVTGGIAAYKACELASRLRKAGAQVYVIMTKNACQFVAPLTFETLSNHPVATDTFARPETWEVEHVALAKRADVFVIAPATANILAKMACGLADDMLSTTVLATRAPVLVAPAMNTGMWDNPATQENVERLQQRGVHFIGPEGGFLACGDTGEGRMSEPKDIFDAIEKLLAMQQDLAGLSVLVTAGPTQERLDPVRFITNRSSGKMGYAIAAAAAARGASVTLVTGPTSLPIPQGVNAVRILSTQELYGQMLALCPKMDVVIQAAAPADFTPETVADQKIKKQGNEPLVIRLTQTPDVAAAVGKTKKEGQTLVGFAAETNDVLQNAQKKLAKKNLDLIVANDVTAPGAGFDVDTNIVTFVTQDGLEKLPKMKKAEVADALLDRILRAREGKRQISK
ncbi:MAG: bifunctional phosphopantothenoylcysteine decarboxylase/phosphopantothenate--cysteine ligase CoaBC [Eubacteriales bacterium]|nr:bifunctional phosphopantothenoylcysteine decarboxylase/phosphopantothenate--cysteine ligase CoaBC [Eubacteriales bacterium]